MSRRYNEQLSLLEVLASKIRGWDVQTRHTYLNRAGDVSKETLTDGLILWCCVAWDTIPSRCDATQHYTVISQWLYTVLSHPIEDVLDACKDLAESMTRIRFGSYDAFKRHHRRVYPWVGELCSPASWVLKDAVDWSNPDSYRRARTFLLFLTRINLVCKDLEGESVQKFCENVDRVNTLFSSERSNVGRLQPYIQRWFKSAEITLLPHAKHGTGRTAEISGKDVCISKKYACLKTDQLTRFVDPDLPSNGELDRQSELICVPKDYHRYRTICAEPTTLMFMQQGVSHSLREALKVSELAHHVTLEDQEPNAFLAQIGSLDGSFSTIDLSDASDSVSWKLVRESFRMTPFLRYFYACRSRRVKLPTGRILELPMFATMGNALTFPVECIIFAAIVEYSLDSCGIPDVSRSYRVYGDDIVCSSRVTPTVISTLTELGFKVNTLKTFVGPPGFRESCGGEFLLGYDVTPLRISRRFSSITTENKASQYEDRISLANRLYWGDYPMARGYLLSQVKKTFGTPFFSDDPMRDDCFYSPNATNYQLPRRWNTRYSRTEYLSSVIKTQIGPRVEEWNGFHLDDYRYFEWGRVKEIDRISEKGVQSDPSITVDVVKPLVYDRAASTSLSKAWRARD